MDFETWKNLPAEERKRIQNQPGYKIFHSLFRVRLQKHEIFSESDIRTRGTFTTGSDVIDNQMNQMSEWVYRTIAQLVDIWERRSPIIFEDHENKTREIHEIIQSHIENMLGHLEAENTSMISHQDESTQNLKDDLRRLDDFAKGIYEHSRVYQPERNRMEVLLDPTGGSLRLNEDEDRRNEIKHRKYVEIDDRFKERGLRGTRRWR